MRPGAGTTCNAATVPPTPWDDPDLQGEWTSEGEFGVSMERPAQFGSRAFLTDGECHEGNYGITNMLATSRALERKAQ